MPLDKLLANLEKRELLTVRLFAACCRIADRMYLVHKRGLAALRRKYPLPHDTLPLDKD